MILDRQFHPQAKACLSICGDFPCLDTPSKRGDTLSEAGESEALSRVCASRAFSRIPVVDHLGMNRAVLTGESDDNSAARDYAGSHWSRPRAPSRRGPRP